MQKKEVSNDILVDTFVLLDFDRTLGNTEYLHAQFVSLVEEKYVLPLGSFDAVKAAVERAGGSFDTAKHLEKILSSIIGEAETVKREMAKIRYEFINLLFKDQNVLEPGARELLNSLTRQSVPFGIITYGGEWWQQAKLQASGLAQIPYLVTGHKQKGKLLSSWYEMADESFSLPVQLRASTGIVAARYIYLVDDKPVSFEDFPKVNAYGYLYTGSQRDSHQEGELPANVATIISLSDVIIDKT